MKFLNGVVIGLFILFCIGSALITVAAIYYPDTYTPTEAYTAIISGAIKYLIAFAVMYVMDISIFKSKEFTKEINSIRNAAMVFVYIFCIWLLMLVIGFWTHL